MTKSRGKSHSKSDGALQSAAAFRSLPAALARFGVKLEEVIDETGLTPDVLQSSRPIAHAETMNHLLNVCAERTGCPHFGLLVGQNVGLKSLGDVGRLVASAASVGSGLHDLATYFKFHNRAALLWLHEDQDEVWLHYCICEARYESSSQLYAGAAMSAFNLTRELCGADWSPLEVHLPFRRPVDLWPYRSRLKAPLVFDADSLAIRFERRWLPRLLDTANPVLHESLERQFKRLDAMDDDDWPAELRRLIRRQLLVGKCGADDVACVLGVHRRTLARRLQEHGTTHRELLEAVKYEMAQQLLRDTDLPVHRIAAHLRYGGVANFSTAFHHWSGEAPREFRARAGQPPSAMAASTSTTPTNRKTRPVSHGRAIVSRAKR